MNMKKLFLLNLPYLLFVYPFDKLAQAFRLAPGSDLSGKLLSIGDGFTAALSSPWLSFQPTDLLIGITGAVVLRMAVYLKGKNAKKYRHGIEYGSARWGTAADIAPYMDKDFFQNIPMTQTERITMASRPKQPKYARNKNILVIGGSGSGKTRFFCKPSLLQAHSSYVCTDPKGTLLPEIGAFLEQKKYRIKCLNLINFRKSMRYNPLAYIRSEKDMSGLMQPLMSFIGNFGYVVVCVVGAILAVQGAISFGTIVAFILYVRLFTQPLTQFAQAATNLQSTAAASERVFAFLDEEEMADESDKTNCLVSVRGNVSFRHIHFGYDPAHPVITDFSAEITAGQKIAIVGPTGAGKTTLVNLLMRFYEVQRGEILIDNVPINQMRREDVHELFDMVLQDTWLFEGTVRENIAYARERVTIEQVVSTCKAVGLHHFIMTLPDGYDTVLSDHVNLSAGQRQQIAIARAMVVNAPMLILDEATSSVDTRTELMIQRAMDRLMEGRTSFVIAHRLSTIRNADLILVLKDGDVIESGKHEELIARGGFYQALYNSQFEAA